MKVPYTPQELYELLVAVHSGARLPELGASLHRPVGGIASKLQRLSKVDPDRWSPTRVREILRDYRNDQWRSPRRDLGKVEECRRRVLAFLREHPDSKRRDFETAGLGWDLSIAYAGRVNAVRRDLAVGERPSGTRVPAQQRMQRLLAFLKEHPTATARDLARIGYLRDVCVAYGNHLDAARRDAGVLPAGYISAAQAARELGVSREWVSTLVEGQRLDGYRIGRRVYVSVASIDARKGATQAP